MTKKIKIYGNVDTRLRQITVTAVLSEVALRGQCYHVTHKVRDPSTNASTSEIHFLQRATRLIEEMREPYKLIEPVGGVRMTDRSWGLSESKDILNMPFVTEVDFEFAEELQSRLTKYDDFLRGFKSPMKKKPTTPNLCLEIPEPGREHV